MLENVALTRKSKAVLTADLPEGNRVVVGGLEQRVLTRGRERPRQVPHVV